MSVLAEELFPFASITAIRSNGEKMREIKTISDIAYLCSLFICYFRANEEPIEAPLLSGDDDVSGDEQYDVGENLFEPGASSFEPCDAIEDPLLPLKGPEVDSPQLSGDEHVLALEIDQVDAKEEPFDLELMQVSLDNNTSTSSDCVITAEYYEAVEELDQDESA